MDKPKNHEKMFKILDENALANISNKDKSHFLKINMLKIIFFNHKLFKYGPNSQKVTYPHNNIHNLFNPLTHCLHHLDH